MTELVGLPVLVGGLSSRPELNGKRARVQAVASSSSGSGNRLQVQITGKATMLLLRPECVRLDVDALVGARVELHSIAAKPELNGLHGSVEYVDEAKSRAAVRTDKGAVSIKLTSLRLLPATSTASQQTQHGLEAALRGEPQAVILEHAQKLQRDGHARIRRGDARGAHERYEQLLNLVPLIEGPTALSIRASALSSLGSACNSLGKYTAAVRQLMEALDLDQQLSAEFPEQRSLRRSVAVDLGYLGASYGHLGEDAKALEHHTKALELSLQLGEKELASTDLGCLSSLYAKLGQPERAFEYRMRGLNLSREIADERMVGVHLHNLASLYQTRQELDLAVDCLKQAIGIDRKRGVMDAARSPEHS